MRLKVTFILIFALVLKLNAQVYPDVNARLFTIVQKGDTVNFLKVDTRLTKKTNHYFSSRLSPDSFDN